MYGLNELMGEVLAALTHDAALVVTALSQRLVAAAAACEVPLHVFTIPGMRTRQVDERN